MTELKIKILDIVSKENIKMIPRWKFVLYSVLTVVGLFFIFFLAVFTGSLVLFVLSKYGFLDIPFFDFLKTLHALSAIPLLLLFTTVFLLVVIEIISRSYTFTFRKPLGITLLVITSCTVIVSYAVSQTPIHEILRNYARDHNIDMMKRAYDRPRPFARGGDMAVLRGVVTEISTSTILIRTFDGAIRTVYGSTTNPMFNKFEIGADVVAFGRMHEDDFQIDRIKVLQKGLQRNNNGKTTDNEMRLFR
jgi:uncharacterized BrkB/YihY/UPF0761 family membrane protein